METNKDSYEICPLKGYEGKYEIDENGNIWKLPFSYVTSNGRKIVNKSRILRPHQLLKSGYQNHKDGNKDNCHVSNLEWITHTNNMKHAKDIGLINGIKEEQLEEILERIKEGKTIGSIANELGVHKRTVVRTFKRSLKFKYLWNEWKIEEQKIWTERCELIRMKNLIRVEKIFKKFFEPEHTVSDYEIL